jgi:cyanate lyase
MTREDLAEKIIAAKTAKGLTWKELAEKVGKSPCYVTAALLGQMTLSAEAAQAVAQALDLEPEAVTLLRTVPYRGSLGEVVPTDPLIYRFYELIQVYGTTLKALIEEEFGDGIMSAIDFEMNLERGTDPEGDRVKVTLNGKFLPYRSY